MLLLQVKCGLAYQTGLIEYQKHLLKRNKRGYTN